MVSNGGNKIFSFYEDAKNLYKNKMVTPRFVSIWLTTVCQLGCDYCYFSKFNKQDKKFIDTKKLLEFIDILAEQGTESIEFSGGGEPTLHPDCFEIADYAVSKGLKVGLLTNGARFDFSKTNCFSYIRIGLDASNAESYSEIKNCGEKMYHKTISNVLSLLRKRIGNKLPKIGLKFMITTKNHYFLYDMIKLSENLGVDYCHFKATHNDKHSIHTSLLPQERSILEHKLENLKRMSPDFVLGSLKRIPLKTKCFMSPIHTVITANGDLLVCCYFNSNEYIVGNIFSSHFNRIWFSKRHRDIIAKIQPKDCNKVDCRWAFYNNEMKEIIENGKYNMSFI